MQEFLANVAEWVRSGANAAGWEGFQSWCCFDDDHMTREDYASSCRQLFMRSVARCMSGQGLLGYQQDSIKTTEIRHLRSLVGLRAGSLRYWCAHT